MTSSQNQDSEGKKPTGESSASVSPVRRRLIKGLAASAPGIFTLYSGNAQAMASTYQCIASTRQSFDGNQEVAGNGKIVDGFVRLAQSKKAIKVVPTDPKHRYRKQEKWLIKVNGAYIEAGSRSENSGIPDGGRKRKRLWGGGNTTSGTSWNEVLSGNKQWRQVAVEDGARKKRRFIDPDNTSNIYEEADFYETKTMQVLACVDDHGNVVSANPQDCNNMGLTPTSASCWASCT